MQSPSIHAEPSTQTVHMATETKEIIQHYGNSHVKGLTNNCTCLDSEHSRDHSVLAISIASSIYG